MLSENIGVSSFQLIRQRPRRATPSACPQSVNTPWKSGKWVLFRVEKHFVHVCSFMWTYREHLGIEYYPRPRIIFFTFTWPDHILSKRSKNNWFLWHMMSPSVTVPELDNEIWIPYSLIFVSRVYQLCFQKVGSIICFPEISYSKGNHITRYYLRIHYLTNSLRM